MKTKDDIEQAMLKSSRWRFEYENRPDIFDTELQRRVKIHNTLLEKEWSKQGDILYGVRTFLWKKRSHYQSEYQKDIHDRENFKNLDRVESIDFVLRLLEEMEAPQKAREKELGYGISAGASQ